MKILLTGGAGFIGKYILDELLKNNHTITLLIHNTTKQITNEKVNTLKADITRPKTLNFSRDFDCVIHNAALATDYASYKKLYQVNCLGTTNVLNACEQAGITNVVYTSTAGVYGFPNTTTPITENSAKKPYSAYQKTKYLGELQTKNYENLDIKLIRPPLVIGPQGKPIQVIMNKLTRGTMSYVGSGTTTIPIVHPKDVAALITLCLNKKTTQPEPYNVVSLHTTPKELFESLCSAFHLDQPTKHVPYPLAYLLALTNETVSTQPTLTRFQIKSLGTTRTISAQKAQKQLNYRPQYSSLDALIDDIKENYVKTKAT